jgi:TonB family protein
MMRHITGFAFVAAFHLIAISILLQSYGHFPFRTHAHETLTTLFLRPAIQEGHDSASGPDASMLVIPMDAPLPSLNIPAPLIAYETARAEGATITAPTLRPDNAVPMAQFIAQAALLPGEGATVVLKIEVLATGDPGRIEVDASSGSRQVDQAAVDYARQHRWYAGRVGDNPDPMWIRWGVRLQA